MGDDSVKTPVRRPVPPTARRPGGGEDLILKTHGEVERYGASLVGGKRPAARAWSSTPRPVRSRPTAQLRRARELWSTKRGMRSGRGEGAALG